MGFELTVLGKYSPFPPASGAGSGYLIRGGGEYLLLDCGNGTLSRLQKFIGIDKVSALLLSHHHPDHKGDISSLRHAWQALIKQAKVEKPLRLYTTDEPRREVSKLSRRSAFDLIKLRRGFDYPFRSFLIEWIKTHHPLKCAAFAINYDGKKMVYTGDTELRAGSELYSFCRGADLLLCEASLNEEEKGVIPGHMSAKEAAHLANEAGVKKLILTHFWPFYDEEGIKEKGREIFKNTHVAKEEKTYVV